MVFISLCEMLFNMSDLKPRALARVAGTKASSEIVPWKEYYLIRYQRPKRNLKLLVPRIVSFDEFPLEVFRRSCQSSLRTLSELVCRRAQELPSHPCHVPERQQSLLCLLPRLLNANTCLYLGNCISTHYPRYLFNAFAVLCYLFDQLFIKHAKIVLSRKY